MRAGWGWILFLTLVAGCGLHRPAPLTEPGAGDRTENDEARLIADADAFDHELQRSGLVVSDSPLAGYVSAVGARVVPSNLPADRAIRFAVLRSPDIQAFALPNGTVYVALGLLARIENEAQLAQLLAHEATHVIRRHSLARTRDLKAGATVAEIADIATLGVAGGLVRLPVGLGLLGFVRSQEEEADRLGLQAALAAGYDGRALVSLYDTIRKALPPVLANMDSIYATHPSLTERSRYLNEALPADGSGGSRVDAEQHERLLAEWQHEYVRLLVVAKQFETGLEWVEVLRRRLPDDHALDCDAGDAHLGIAEDPENAAIDHAVRAQTRVTEETVEEYRKKRTSEAEEARRFYESCARSGAAQSRAARGLGLAAHVLGDSQVAHRELVRYLEFEGGRAPDRRYIEFILSELK